jgi:hypothetical protein
LHDSTTHTNRNIMEWQSVDWNDFLRVYCIHWGKIGFICKQNQCECDVSSICHINLPVHKILHCFKSPVLKFMNHSHLIWRHMHLFCCISCWWHTHMLVFSARTRNFLGDVSNLVQMLLCLYSISMCLLHVHLLSKFEPVADNFLMC